jgi:hypothetical protein
VPFVLVETPAGSAYAGGRWAEPDLDAAAAAMRRLVDDPDHARDLGRRGREHVAQVCSWQRTEQFLLEQESRTAAFLVERAPRQSPLGARLVRKARRPRGSPPAEPKP